MNYITKNVLIEEHSFFMVDCIVYLRTKNPKRDIIICDLIINSEEKQTIGVKEIVWNSII